MPDNEMQTQRPSTSRMANGDDYISRKRKIEMQPNQPRFSADGLIKTTTNNYKDASAYKNSTSHDRVSFSLSVIISIIKYLQ